MAKVARILIVDDNARCVQFMQLAFESCGHADVAAETRPAAVLDRIRVDQPDLILLDINMPEVDGLQILKCLRADHILTPVIMCSGASEPREIARAYAAGCNGYVEKPGSLADYRKLAGAILEYWQLNESPGRPL